MDAAPIDMQRFDDGILSDMNSVFGLHGRMIGKGSHRNRVHLRE